MSEPGAKRLRACIEGCRESGRPALVIYLTVGDPSLEDSLACARAAVEAGADILELGVPFSDATADGPTIAAASHRAIAAGGSLRATLKLSEQLGDVPRIVFTYYNPVIAFGERELPGAVRAAGADGMLLVDLPIEEGAALRAAADEVGSAIVPLVAPTSGPERERLALERATGFVYYVSMTGVTGAGDAPLEEAARAAAQLREKSGKPVALGFGIDGPEKAQLVAQHGVDAVVVGSAVVRAVHAGTDSEARVAAVRSLVGALRAALEPV